MKSDAEIISEITRRETRLLYYFPEEIKATIGAGRAVLIKENGELAAFALWDYYGNDWIEIHTIYVRPEDRGRGYSRWLIEEIKNRLAGFRGRIFFFTTSPIIMKIGEELGFKKRSLFSLPAGILLKIIIHRLHPRRWLSYFKKIQLGFVLSKTYVFEFDKSAKI